MKKRVVLILFMVLILSGCNTKNVPQNITTQSTVQNASELNKEISKEVNNKANEIFCIPKEKSNVLVEKYINAINNRDIETISKLLYSDIDLSKNKDIISDGIENYKKACKNQNINKYVDVSIKSDLLCYELYSNDNFINGICIHKVDKQELVVDYVFKLSSWSQYKLGNYIDSIKNQDYKRLAYALVEEGEIAEEVINDREEIAKKIIKKYNEEFDLNTLGFNFYGAERNDKETIIRALIYKIKGTKQGQLKEHEILAHDVDGVDIFLYDKWRSDVK